ncbi:hypothetical protein JCM4814A_09330 [Streptomyces phaeofaciens JCM 4814]|uniref:Uncharacterized protein n=1 Tax=Streptomyces phaeofaciens TaxID=68254 RepID=A0A918HT26_9ACTN|nr:hypothetical protein GCM10010226_91620 [Streptomyces phaeofaciens]
MDVVRRGKQPDRPAAGKSASQTHCQSATTTNLTAGRLFDVRAARAPAGSARGGRLRTPGQVLLWLALAAWVITLVGPRPASVVDRRGRYAVRVHPEPIRRS